MLSAVEENGLREILNEIDDFELFSLLETVTKRMVTTKLRHEAIKFILASVEKPSDLLRRQKITKKHIFNYLVKKEIVVLAEWQKPILIQKSLELWNSTESIKEHFCTDLETEKNPGTNTEITLAQMGVEFCKWFFKMFNSQDEFGPQHFWPNCTLHAYFHSPTGEREVSFSGASDVAHFLMILILNDKYYFDANDSNDSVLMEQEAHGLVKIAIHGVLHRASNCVGLFDSAFGLVRHPDSPSVFKIQVVKLRMQVNQAPQGALPAYNHL